MVQEGAAELRLAEILAALSVVTDLGIGRPPEAAMCACILAARLAQDMGLSAQEQSDVYFSTLLRYIGCTAYSHEEAWLAGGDELAARSQTTRVDYRNLREAIGAHATLGSGGTTLQRALVRITSLPRMILANRDLVASHCEVGMSMARRLGMSESVQVALGQIFERWDGKGFPAGLRGDALSLPVRFAHVATQVVAFLPDGQATVEAIVRQRAGGWFDPAIADAFLRRSASLLEEIEDADPWPDAVAAEPKPHLCAAAAQLDLVAGAFADMVDLKTPFTRGHSTGVARLAEEAAQRSGLTRDDVVLVRRSALLHDLGRVAVPNGIWERTGRLSAIEWERVRLHSYQTERILSRAPALRALAPVAGMHHERQDGSGYYRASAGSAIPPVARILAAADVYDAVTHDRPHRPARSREDTATVLQEEVRAGRLDADAVHAVLEAAGLPQARPRRSNPAGLSEREVEVLRLIATGSTYRDVARDLVISPRTAAHHVQHIYNKIGVSTRAAAAMFAMEHELI